MNEADPRTSADPFPAPAPQPPALGERLRRWRAWRRLSQLELAGRAGISARHLSFVENGRSTPSRELLIRLADVLDLPQRGRNDLLLAAGYAPVYSEHPLCSPQLGQVRAILRRMLEAHEPYPAAVVDCCWNLVESNSALCRLAEGADPCLREEPVNVMRLALHPLGLAPRMRNLGQWRAHALARVARRIALTADQRLIALEAELRGYPGPAPEPEHDPGPAPDEARPGPEDIAVPMRLDWRGSEITLVCTVATFGTALDVTVSELAIETFFPADPRSAMLLRRAQRWARQDCRVGG